jgi:predicted N-formylglutamate amidohydrolase
VFTVETDIHECLEHDTHILFSCEPRLPVLIVCDHASCAIPPELVDLGMDKSDLATHIGWDIGAGAVACRLGAMLQVPVVLASTSRLVVDCNRTLDDPSAFPAVSDGQVVPGNQDLSAADRAGRADAYYWPYHHAIRDQLQSMESLAAAPAILAIHSFTPQMDGFQRPWHVGALWDKDSRIAVPFMEALRGDPEMVVGDNEPYSGKHPADFTLDHHAEAEGLPHLAVELRQDLIEDGRGAERWAGIIAKALQPTLEDRALYTLRAGIV